MKLGKIDIKHSINISFSTKVYAVSITKEYAFVMVLKRKRDEYILIDSETFPIDEVAKYLKNKKNIYVNIDQELDFYENIKVPSSIKNSKNIKNFIFYKIKETNPEMDVLLNYNRSPNQTEDIEEISYEVRAVDEKKYLETLKSIGNFENIRSITVSEYSLLNISNKCIKDKEFISVYVQAKRIVVIAVKEENLIFSRTIDVASSTPETLQMEIAENITQTLSYIGTQIRDIRFKTLVISGSIALDDVISSQITMYNNMNISILYPNTFIKNLAPLDAQEHILTIGALLTPKSYRFMPETILGLQQYEKVSSLLLFSSVLILCYTFYALFDEYIRYSKLLEKNHNLKKSYLLALKNTKMFPKGELKLYLDHIERVKTYLDDAPVDILIELKDLIELSRPVSFSYKSSNSFEIVFEKKFKGLKELYNYEKIFSKKFDKINNHKKFMEKVSINYQSLTYSVKISPAAKKSKKIVAKRKL